MKSNNFRGLSLGQTILEVVFAVGLVSLILVTLIGVITIAIRDARIAKNQSLATKFATEGLEALRTIRDANWNNLASSVTDCNKTKASYLYQSSQVWTLRFTPSYDQFVNSTTGIFNRKVFVLPVYRNSGNLTDCGSIGSTIDTNSYQVFVQVIWEESSGQSITQSSTLLTNKSARPI